MRKQSFRRGKRIIGVVKRRKVEGLSRASNWRARGRQGRSAGTTARFIVNEDTLYICESFSNQVVESPQSLERRHSEEKEWE